MLDWNELDQKVKQWQKVFDETKELIGSRKITFDRRISCYHKFAPRVYELSELKEVWVDDNMIKGDIVVAIENNVGKRFHVIVSRAFEAKAFGDVMHPEVLLIKIKDYLSKHNKIELEEFASMEL